MSLQNIFYPDKELETYQLKKAIEILLDKLAKKMLTPAQQAELDAKKNEIIESLFETVKNDKLTLNHFNNDVIIKKLFVPLVITLLAEKQFNKQFIDDLKKELKEKLNIDLEKINTPEELQKLLKDKNIENKLKQKLDAFKTDVKKAFPKLEPKQKSEDPSLDLYTNLFGLICSHTSGGIPAVIQHNWGNANNLPDWNPHHGMSQIDAANKISDTQFGDPLGLNASAISNYLKAEAFDDDLVTEMQNTIRLLPPTPKP
ncbi:MAG: hypothetical protein KIT56_01405 [Gammaproteobacteria bacterium]|nr:hypothetical protein [Gammaproteobacteria bacterium]MCW5582541.1 hypothetical protein [Gammaproteobacteria bacterium]